MHVQKRTAAGALALLVVLLAIFSFTDLAISMAIFNIESGYGKFFEAWGELPGVLVAVFSLAALIITRDKTVKWKSVLSILGFGVLLLLFSMMGAFMPSMYLKLPMPVTVVLAVCFIALSLFLASRVAPAQRAALRKAACIGLLTFVCAIFIINIIKNIWGRPRFRSMTDPAAQFIAWYLPQWGAAGEEFRSFPSGHTANSCVIIWLTTLPLFIPALRGKQKLLLAVSALWIVMVAVSRVIMGAHFASDVTVGAAVTLASYFLLSKAFLKEKKGASSAA